MNTLVDLTTMIVEFLGDWPLGTILGILIIACALLLVSVAVWGLFVAIDSWFLTRNHKLGRVIGKTFTPAHTQIVLVYNVALKMSLPHMIFHPDNWSLRVEVDGQQDSMSVSKNFYDSFSKNDSVLTEYISGRFSGGLYIKALSLV